MELSICFSPLEKRTSGSDRFSLKPTGETYTHVLNQMGVCLEGTCPFGGCLRKTKRETAILGIRFLKNIDRPKWKMEGTTSPLKQPGQPGTSICYQENQQGHLCTKPEGGIQGQLHHFGGPMPKETQVQMCVCVGGCAFYFGKSN